MTILRRVARHLPWLGSCVVVAAQFRAALAWVPPLCGNLRGPTEPAGQAFYLVTALAESMQLGAEGAAWGIGLMLPATFVLRSEREGDALFRSLTTSGVALVTSFTLFASLSMAFWSAIPLWR